MQESAIVPVIRNDANKTSVVSLRPQEIGEFDNRYLPQDRCRQVLECAIALSSIDKSRSSVSSLEAITIAEEKVNPFQMGYSLGIESRYVEAAMQKIYPTNDVQFNDLINIPGVKFETGSRINVYSAALKNALKREFPLDTFETEVEYSNLKFFRVSKKVVTKRFLWKTYQAVEEVREEMADIYLGQSHFTQMKIHTPSFLRATSEDLEKLNQFFGMSSSLVDFTYQVDFIDAMKKQGE